MSILLTDISSIPPVEATASASPLPQSGSGRMPRRPPRRWWSWFVQQDERIALRELADNPRLLKDLGLSRNEVLREAARPFWR